MFTTIDGTTTLSLLNKIDRRPLGNLRALNILVRLKGNIRRPLNMEITLHNLGSVLYYTMLSNLANMRSRSLFTNLNRGARVINSRSRNNIRPLLRFISRTRRLNLGNRVRYDNKFINGSRLQLTNRHGNGSSTLLRTTKRLVKMLRLTLYESTRRLRRLIRANFRLDDTLLQVVSLRRLRSLNSRNRRQIRNEREVLRSRKCCATTRNASLFLKDVRRVRAIRLSKTINRGASTFQRGLSSTRNYNNLANANLARRARHLTMIRVRIRAVSNMSNKGFNVVFGTRIFSFRRLITRFEPPLSRS